MNAPLPPFDLLDSLDARFQAMRKTPPLRGTFAIGAREGLEGPTATRP